MVKGKINTKRKLVCSDSMVETKKTRNAVGGKAYRYLVDILLSTEGWMALQINDDYPQIKFYRDKMAMLKHYF